MEGASFNMCSFKESIDCGHLDPIKALIMTPMYNDSIKKDCQVLFVGTSLVMSVFFQLTF